MLFYYVLYFNFYCDWFHRSGLDVYGLAASNLVAGSNLEATVQQIIDMGGGSWDRDTVVRALRAAFNNPERAVEYLYSVSVNSICIPLSVCCPPHYLI